MPTYAGMTGVGGGKGFVIPALSWNPSSQTQSLLQGLGGSGIDASLRWHDGGKGIRHSSLELESTSRNSQLLLQGLGGSGIDASLRWHDEFLRCRGELQARMTSLVLSLMAESQAQPRTERPVFAAVPAMRELRWHQPPRLQKQGAGVLMADGSAASVLVLQAVFADFARIRG